MVIDMEEDPKIPIILGKSFLNTTCALIDVCESTLTLRVGDESAMFRAIPEAKQEEKRKEEISFIHLDDEILQKELELLQEKDPNKFLLPSGEHGDVNKDLEEIETLLEGAYSENTEEIVEYDPTRRVTLLDSMSPVEIANNLDDLDLLVTSSMHILDLDILHDSIEEQTAEGEMDTEV